LKVSLHIGWYFQKTHHNQYYPPNKMVRLPNIDLDQENDEVLPVERVLKGYVKLIITPKIWATKFRHIHVQK
jgi:hypothetical protein